MDIIYEIRRRHLGQKQTISAIAGDGNLSANGTGLKSAQPGVGLISRI